MDYIVVPDSGQKLVEGNVILLVEYPGIRWVLHHGVYEYDDEEFTGWYANSIPDMSVIPITEDDLKGVILVSAKLNDVLPPYPYTLPPQRKPLPPGPCPPHPPGPHPPVPPVPPPPIPPEDIPAFFSKALETQLAEAFISVKDIEERDALHTDKLPDGKIVRVNNVLGVAKYYQWSVDGNCWVAADLLTDDRLIEVLSTIHVVAGDGLLGGGEISQDVTVSHGDTGTGSSEIYTGSSDLDIISSIHADKFGHVTIVDTKDVTSAVADAAENNPRIAKITDLPVWSIAE